MQLHAQPIGQDKKRACLRQMKIIQEKTKSSKSLQVSKENTKKIIPYILNEKTENVEANNLIHRLD